jgi:hypothetical protein
LCFINKKMNAAGPRAKAPNRTQTAQNNNVKFVDSKNIAF